MKQCIQLTQEFETRLSKVQDSYSYIQKLKESEQVALKNSFRLFKKNMEQVLQSKKHQKMFKGLVKVSQKSSSKYWTNQILNLYSNHFDVE